MVGFKSPWEFISKDWKRTLKFALLLLLLAIIPILGPFLLMGLIINLLSNLLQNKGMPKVFSNYKTRILDGIKYLLFILLWQILIILTTVISALPLILTNGIPTSEVEIIIMTSSPMLLFPMMIIPGMLLLFGFTLPASILNYADKKEFKAFFAFKEIMTKISNNLGGYLKMFLTQILFMILVNLIAITIIGALLIPGLNVLIMGRIWTDWYKES